MTKPVVKNSNKRKGGEPLHVETKRAGWNQVEIIDGLDIDLSFSLNVVEMIRALEETEGGYIANKSKYEWVLFEMERKLIHAQELLRKLDEMRK